jgi:predicted metal-dependent hydrolase
MDTKLGDYVIGHELLHLSVANHGKHWEMRMRAYLGDSNMIEQRLRARVALWRQQV